MAQSRLLGPSKEKTNGTKISRLLIDGGTYVSRMYFDSFHPPGTLPQVLNNSRILLEDLKTKRVIRDAQWEKLFPSSGDPPDTKTFDITLLHLLIRSIYHSTLNWAKWNAMPADSDQTCLANIIRIRCFRNSHSHRSSTGISDDEFDDLWDKISSALAALGLDQTEIDRLKIEPIEHDTPRVKEEDESWRLAQELQQGLENLKRDVQQLKDQLSNNEASKETAFGLSSYLPDEVTNVFGRDKEIEQVVELIKTGKEAAVLITGGPGFGKTTMANKAAYELAKPDQDRTVFFCNIMSMTTVDEVANRMCLTCSKHLTQLSEKPRLWLLNWGKQLESRVTFVLDNADEVLDRNGDACNEFWRFLDDFRTLSKQNVNFIITSRLECNPLTLKTKNIRLGCLSMEEANKVVSSRMQVSNFGSTAQKLSKAEKLVELCGYVPLALCVAGSLLSKGVYTEDELISRLEEEPTDVLQCDRRPSNETSVAKSIRTSLLALDDCEQQSLILLCSLPGSFNVKAARFLISGACLSTSESESISILGELIDRSLVEQPLSQRYEIHSLIRASARKFGQEKFPELFAEGEKIACAYFISCITENAQLYWGKDTCKASLESFNKERHNFEHFLPIYCQEMQNQDQKNADTCERFLDDLSQKCMYLEKCVQPKFYIRFLEGLLKSFKPQIQPVHTVELLCLLGHEMRKEGDDNWYINYMEEANRLYSKNITKFETRALSHVNYLQSYARFLSEGKVPSVHNPKVLYDKATKICEDKLPEHPERAAILLFAGRYAKRRKDYDEAAEKFKQAFSLLEQLLGDHFMTAQCIKDMADYTFSPGETCLDDTLALYKMAMEVLEKLGVDDHKESILTLKNYGSCHMANGDFEEAMKLFERAERVAERELDKDHKWKVMITTQKALLYYQLGREEEMEVSLKHGLDMHYRIVGNRSINGLANKHLIWNVLSNYPHMFPEEDYPCH